MPYSLPVCVLPSAQRISIEQFCQESFSAPISASEWCCKTYQPSNQSVNGTLPKSLSKPGSLLTTLAQLDVNTSMPKYPLLMHTVAVHGSLRHKLTAC